MAQELADKIRAAAQAKNIDPDIALAIARAESSLRPSAQAGTSSAGGLFQVVDKTWREFGGNPKKKLDADENIRVGTDIIAKNTQTLKSFLNRDPRPAEVYAAHYFGPSGAKNFLSADPATPIVDILGKKAVAANPNLKNKNVGQVMAQLEKKMGSGPAPAANVSRETPAPARQPLPPSLPPMAATEESSAPPSRMASLGPSYQAALALSFLADTDDKEDRDIDREPGVAEKWLAEQAPRPAALAEFANVSIKSPFAAMEPQQPQMLADGGEVGEQSAPDVGRPTVSETQLAKVMFPDLPVAEAVYLIRGGQRQSTPQGEMLMGNLGAMVPMGNDSNAMLMLSGSRPEREMTESKALMAAFNKRVGDEGGLNLNVVRPLDAPGGVLAGGLSASYPLGEGRISGNVNALRLPGQDPRITGYGVGYGGRVGPGNLSAMIMKQKDGPYSGQVEYRLPIGRADGGEAAPTEEELAAASRPATGNPNIRRQGEAARRLAAMRDVNTLPDPRTYAAVSGFLGQAPDEMGFSAMHPDAEGIKKAGQAGFGVGTALQVAPVAGKAAQMLGKMTGSALNDRLLAGQSLTPGFNTPAPINFAVRNKGTPFVMSYGDTPGPDGAFPSMDQAEKYVRGLATTNDQPLNNWFSNKVTPYLRRDFASPEDQFVRAADEGKLLHLAPKPTKRDPAESASQYDRRKNLEGTRKIEGFPEEGVATTAYGKRVEALTDASAWPAWLEDITSPGLVPPSMRGMVDTNPSARVTELGSNVDKKLKFEDLRDGMMEMRQLGPEYSAYGQAPVKVPKEYLLTDESLIGLTPAQASNRVATFRNWRDDNRQRMATKYAKEDPSLDRVELPGGVTAVQLPDLQSSPNVKQLALDVGCDGNWCTQREASALDYGSGNNRLHILVDKKARPLAQITFSRLPPTKKQLEADPSAGDRFSITEMLGKDNSADFSQNPALPAIQQYVKSLDRQNGLAFVANLDKINMKELSTADLLKGAKELSDRRQRYQPGISPEDYMAATQRDIIDFETALYELNGGSKYLTKDQDMNSLVQQTLDRLAPQQRANGGMIERQSTDNRRYL
jgi:hypothetical protein